MKMMIGQQEDNTWSITPESGALQGVVIAVADGVSLRNSIFVARTVVGTLKAVWGLTVKVDEVYNDVETLRALQLGRCFGEIPEDKLVIDYDGWLDRANRVCKTAHDLVLMNKAIFAKGIR